MFVTNSLTGGGAERAMNLASNELSRRDWAIALVPINSGPSDFIEPVSEVFPLGRKWRGGFLGTVYSFIQFNIVVRSWKPDVVVLTCDLPEFFGAFLLASKKLVIVEEASYPWGTRENFGRIVRKMLAIRQVRTIAASSHLKIWPNRVLPDAVIENAITPFDVSHGPRGVDCETMRLNFIGRLSAEKRPDWFIEVCKIGGFKGRVIGDGVMKQVLIDNVNTKGVDVEFSGFLKDPWAVLQEKDLLIAPSAFEGDGLVVIEAIKHGVPLLISDIPDFRRFRLPERNYCKDVPAFVRRASDYMNKLNELVVPGNVAIEILESRSTDTVGDKWEAFLNSM
jgi:glycosyltransferase involved in cell wall biosynthesis